MTRSLLLVLSVVVLEAIGFSLIMPILPQLLTLLSGEASVATHYGWILSIYAVMQFFCAPVLGALSDRFGRRPVLLVSLLGSAVDYLIMAWAPTFWVLLIGRVIAGVTGAGMAVVTAYIADTTVPAARAKRYGQMEASIGLGIIAGPAIGGLLGAFSLHLPFLAAAGLNGLMFLLILFLLPESRPASSDPQTRKPIDIAAFNIITQLRRLSAKASMKRLLGLFMTLHIAGQIPATLWVLFMTTRFGWDTRWTGLSLTVFGILHAVVQGGLTGPLTRWLGERRCLILAMLSDGLAFILLAVITDGRLVFAIMPLLTLGGIAAPALQALLTNLVGDDRQGELQGSLASLGSLVGIAGPLVFTAIYGATMASWPGLVWLIGAALYAIALPAFLWRRRQAAFG